MQTQSLTRTTREREDPEAESERGGGGGEGGREKEEASTPSCNLGNHHEVLSTRAACVVGAEPRSSFFFLSPREAHTHTRSHKIPISSPDVTLKGSREPLPRRGRTPPLPPAVRCPVPNPSRWRVNYGLRPNLWFRGRIASGRLPIVRCCDPASPRVMAPRQAGTRPACLGWDPVVRTKGAVALQLLLCTYRVKRQRSESKEKQGAQRQDGQMPCHSQLRNATPKMISATDQTRENTTPKPPSQAAAAAVRLDSSARAGRPHWTNLRKKLSSAPCPRPGARSRRHHGRRKHTGRKEKKVVNKFPCLCCVGHTHTPTSPARILAQ